MNHLRRLIGQREQQRLIFRAERILADGVDVEHADERALDEQRHRQLAAHVFADGDVARIGRHVRHPQRLAGLRHPAGHATSDGQLELPGFVAQPDRHLDFQQLRMRIDQDQRAAGRVHDLDGLTQHEIEHARRVER